MLCRISRHTFQDTGFASTLFMVRIQIYNFWVHLSGIIFILDSVRICRSVALISHYQRRHMQVYTYGHVDNIHIAYL
jgi:hypothetical protein